MIHMVCFDQTGTERCVSGDIKTSIVLNFILKVGEHSDCHSICRADHLIPTLGQIADNIRLSPFESSYLFSWHCRTKLYDLPLHWSHILSIVWLCFNKLKMNVSCLSKAQRLRAEFVEKLGCIVSQTVEAFVRMQSLFNVLQGRDLLTSADTDGHTVDGQKGTACPGDAN